MHSKGADLVIEASGHDSSLAAVLDYVRIGGRVTFVGISIGRPELVALSKALPEAPFLAYGRNL